MKTYLKLKENGRKLTHIKIEVYYSLGGYNYFTYKKEERGYYLSVSPVERSEFMEVYTSFTGYKQLIKPVSRKSKKAEQEAEAIYKDYLPALLEAVLAKSNLELEDVAL